MNKTVTSAGHDEERIGAFVSEGKAANEQSTDTVPTQAADTSANTGEVHAASDSAVSEGEAAKSNLLAPYQPKRRILQPSQANFMLRAILPSQQIETTMRMSQLGLRLPGGGSETEQVHQGSDDGSEGRATGVMSFVSRHLPVWRSVVALRQQIQAQQTQIQAQQTQIQAQQRQIQTQQDQLDTLNALATELRQRERLSGSSAHDQARMDAWYQDLQDLHRGSQESLTEGQRAYIHHFNDRAADLQLAGPIFDLGCGRGEWLALMAAEGWAVRGVDSSEVAVAEACAQGLDVELGDLVEALEACPENALAGVTAFQVVEHLPFSRITALMHAAFRALVPGGILLLETPNPENLQVATYGFWMDPTHRHPIPPPLIMDLSFHVGFRDGSILRKNPWPQWQETKVDSSLESEVGYRLFGPQDYALLVYKPATAD